MKQVPADFKISETGKYKVQFHSKRFGFIDFTNKYTGRDHVAQNDQARIRILRLIE